MAKKGFNKTESNTQGSSELDRIQLTPETDIHGNRVDERVQEEKGGKTKGKKAKSNIILVKEPDKSYSMIKDIKESWLYRRKSLGTKDDYARKFIEDSAQEMKPSDIQPGQLILFKYLNPKGREELEYYDASPCTIFFGIVNTNEGERLLGFNIHYYPPKMRYRIMNKIFELYKPVYVKYFDKPNTGRMDAFDYKFLIRELEKAKLTFGVRMYIPSKMTLPKVITTNMWKVAVFTEGWFKKKTRGQILGFWNQWKEKNAK